MVDSTRLGADFMRLRGLKSCNLRIQSSALLIPGVVWNEGVRLYSNCIPLVVCL
jgi:hypothetical protein